MNRPCPALSLMLLSFALAGSVTRRFWAKNAGHGPAVSLKNRILSSIGLKLVKANAIEGEIRLHLEDDSTFKAKKM